MENTPLELSIDRFEDRYAVCETQDGETLLLPREKLPANAAQGDILIIDGDVITIDKERTARVREENYDLFSKLMKN